MQSMEVIVEWHDQHYFIEKKTFKKVLLYKPGL